MKKGVASVQPSKLNLEGMELKKAQEVIEDVAEVDVDVDVEVEIEDIVRSVTEKNALPPRAAIARWGDKTNRE